MQPETNGLQEASRDAASGLRQGDEPARTEMEDLADAVERAGEQVIPQDELASQMRNARQTQAQQGGGDSSQSSSRLRVEIRATPARSRAPPVTPSGVDADASSGSKEMRRGANVVLNPVKVAAKARRESRGEGGRPPPPETRTARAWGSWGSWGCVPTWDERHWGGERRRLASAQQGAGAGTGEAGDPTGEEGAASAANLSVGAGEDPADANVSTGGAEADPAALEGANLVSRSHPARVSKACRPVRRRVGDARLRCRGDGRFRVRRARRGRRRGTGLQPGSRRAPGNGRALFFQRWRRMSASNMQPAGWRNAISARCALRGWRPFSKRHCWHRHGRAGRR